MPIDLSSWRELYFLYEALTKTWISCSAAENYNIDEFFSRIACITFNDIMHRESLIETEKKTISPMVQKGPRKIALDQEFMDKTSEKNGCVQRCPSWL